MAKINKVRLSGQTYDIEDSYAAKTVSLTQAQYDALVSGGTVDPNTLYVITDAEGVDLSDYWTSAVTESAITYATSGKVENSDFVAHSGDTSIHVTSNDKQNWNSKQAALTAGSGITINAYNKISLAVPITSGSGNNSIVEGIGTSASGTAAHVEGYNSKANGVYSHSEGSETKANGSFSHTEGNHTIANNEAEHASGKYNVSNSGETASATTLFSVGNGTSTSARHNAFEIRQNGDIYITSGGTDIKLQDNLGGGGGGGITSGEVQTMIDEATSGYTARFAEDEEVTAAGLNALNETLSGKQDTLSAGTNITIVDNVISASGGGTPTVELTQAEYDALVSGGTVEPNTYYIITDAQAIDISQYYTSAQTNSAIAAAVSGKVNTSSVVSSVTSASTDSEIPTAKAVWEAASGGGGSITIDPSLDTSSTNAVANSAITQNFNNYAKYIGDGSNGYGTSLNGSEGTGNYMGINLQKYKYNGGGTQTNITCWFRISTINGKKAFSTKASNVADFNLIETSAITSAITSASTDSQVPSAKAVYDKFDEVEQVTAAGLNALNDKFGGLKIQQITQSDYNALQTKDASTLYVIVN